ncbi:exodeoxyribonuclease VII large subunit [Candidatus Saccharibacteria bacterium]|nr:exodeoxyribonuclease VII large subunit [Candidatus Saccharibacteria bacterium]
MNEIEQILAEQERQAATEAPKFTVSEFTELLNGTLEYAYTGVMVEGEVTSFKVNQGKWVFFDLKDEGGSINCFMPLFQLRLPLEDGMKVVVKATPKLTKWGRFSLTVKQILPVGEGNIKKSFEFLKKKLEQEGLFDVSRKRPIPEDLVKIGVISSTQAAGYVDFCKIINERWGGLEIQVAHTMVQGLAAAEQIISAIKYFNEKAEVQIIAIMRGGGSADDLAVFNDEALVRAIAESRIPIITGIGHEVDESLADLAADIRASTPSNVAEMLTNEKQAEIQRIKFNVNGVGNKILQEIEQAREGGKTKIKMVGEAVNMKISHLENEIKVKQKVLEGLNPDTILKQGYALVTGKLKEGEMVEIATYESKAKAEIKEVKKRIK